MDIWKGPLEGVAMIHLGSFYKDKKVLVTGHTGFKGAWLTTWLKLLGANVYGISLGEVSNPSMFSLLKMDEKINSHFCDIRDYQKFSKIYNDIKPDFVFHLAAQAIVSESYKNPLETLSTNIMGTANLLDIIKNDDRQVAAVFITSDKCYENVEWEYGYREIDRLGGKDIYSASKGASELVFWSFYNSFFTNHKACIATARAGNVIGGGDWAKSRLIPDIIKSWLKGESVEIRSPKATRPWQHVLEPLSGYLVLMARLHGNRDLSGESYNFGPSDDNDIPVVDVVNALSESFVAKDYVKTPVVVNEAGGSFKEAGLLKLNCDKAKFNLSWKSTLNFNETIDYISVWYKQFNDSKVGLYDLTCKQIMDYTELATKKKSHWRP